MHAEQQSGTVAGVICTLGGQTPLGLAQRLKDVGVPVLGTQPEAIDLAEHRGAFGRVLAEAGLPAPKHGTAISFEQAKAVADGIGYPVLVRPSYVLGGRGMEIVYDEEHLLDYINRATEITADHPVLVDRFLDDAVEIDVDALYDGTRSLSRRRDGAHRGSRHPLRRLGVRAAADHARRRRHRRGAPLDAGDRAGRRRARPAQRAVRPGRRHPLRARSEPARVAHRPVRVEGDRGAAGEGRGPHRGRHDDQGAARRGHAAHATATAAICPPTRRSR